MKFSELSKKRKLAVQVLIQEYPEIAETGTITLKQLRTWWDDKYSKLEKRDVGYPIWIFSESVFRTPTKGVYSVPVPTESDALVTADAPKTKTLKPKTSKVKQKTLKELTSVKTEVTINVGSDETLTDEEFAAECRAAGIEI